MTNKQHVLRINRFFGINAVSVSDFVMVKTIDKSHVVKVGEILIKGGKALTVFGHDISQAIAVLL